MKHHGDIIIIVMQQVFELSDAVYLTLLLFLEGEMVLKSIDRSEPGGIHPVNTVLSRLPSVLPFHLVLFKILAGTGLIINDAEMLCAAGVHIAVQPVNNAGKCKMEQVMIFNHLHGFGRIRLCVVNVFAILLKPLFSIPSEFLFTGKYVPGAGRIGEFPVEPLQIPDCRLLHILLILPCGCRRFDGNKLQCLFRGLLKNLLKQIHIRFRAYSVLPDKNGLHIFLQNQMEISALIRCSQPHTAVRLCIILLRNTAVLLIIVFCRAG